MMKIDVATGQLSCKFRVYGVERLHETCRFTRDTPRIYSRNSHSPGSLAGPSSPPLPPPRVITGGTSVRRIRVKTLTSRLSSARSKAHNSFSPRPVSEQKACNARKMLAPDSKLFRSSVITSLGLPPPHLYFLSPTTFFDSSRFFHLWRRWRRATWNVGGTIRG